jgi:hypothetical protein
MHTDPTWEVLNIRILDLGGGQYIRTVDLKRWSTRPGTSGLEVVNKARD